MSFTKVRRDVVFDFSILFFIFVINIPKGLKTCAGETLCQLNFLAANPKPI